MTRIAPIAPRVAPCLALLALGAAGCAGGAERVRGASPQPQSPIVQAAPRTASAPPTVVGKPSRETSTAPAAGRAEAADGAYRAAPEPESERPGLGTEWGETRESRVSSAPFERNDWNRPLSVSSFLYNDESGVRAALGASYWNARTDGVSAARDAITIRLIDESGAPLPTFAAGGRSYVMGRDGARYAIRIENHTSARFEAVATVDGLDVIDGRAGSFEKRGYLVSPWSTVEIDGFRRSEEVVAAFRFGRVQDSYAAKTGDDRNVGVIGIAMFEERGSRWPWTTRELERRNAADPFPGRFAEPPSY